MAAGFDLTRTARSLLSFEVNTIVRDNMTAEPMPPVPHALLDLAGDYAATLIGLGVDLSRYFAPGVDNMANVAFGWSNPPVPLGAELTVSVETFDRLRWAAQQASIATGPEAVRMPGTKRVLLGRIANNADAIKEMLKRLTDGKASFLGKTRAGLLSMPTGSDAYIVSPDDLIQLQKMWDIGVEEIVAQTVVHITGDVTTRVQEALCKPGGETLFAIHRQGIDVSVGCWKYLLDAVREIAGTTVQLLLGGKA